MPMIRYWNGKRRVEYVCKGYHRNGKSYCSSHRIHEEVLDAAVQEFAQTMRVKMAEKQKELKQKQKMWALRKPVLDARIFALQKETQKLELKIDRFLIEKLYVKSNLIYLATRNFSFSYFIIRADFAKKQGRVWNVLGKI